MLCLMRREGERLVFLNDNKILLELTVYEIYGDRCRIAIDAPAEVRVVREKIFNRERDVA